MTQVNPQFVAQVAKVKAALDTLDYFQLLRLPYDADDSAIRAGYHRQARTFHPDRYHFLGAPELVRDLGIIAKRIAEAYVILRDPTKRAEYLSNIQSEQRPGHLRYRETDEEAKRARDQAKSGTTRQGREMYEQALVAHARGDSVTAVQNLKMALLYEKDNATFHELLAAWTREEK